MIRPLSLRLVFFGLLALPTMSTAQNKLRASKAAIAFGALVAQTARVDSFSIKNDSTNVIDVAGITSNDGAVYALSGFTSGNINAGDSDWVYVTFTPAVVQSYPDTVKITHDDPGTTSPVKVVLSGSGTAQSLHRRQALRSGRSGWVSSKLTVSKSTTNSLR